MFLKIVFSLYEHPKVGEPDWFEFYRFEQSYLKNGIDLYYKNGDLRRARIGDCLDKLEAERDSLEKQIDAWFLKAKGVNRQQSIRQWHEKQEAFNSSPEGQTRNLALFGTGEEDELGVWGYIDPQYLVELDKMIAEQKPKYGEPPKVIPLVTKALIFLLKRYHAQIMHQLTMHESYLFWLKEREEYAQQLSERKASMAALRERNQRRRELKTTELQGILTSDDGWR
ncbi:MAG: hypothetical protein HC930_01585 [Hydrococcus sp. SU_1_0]|nr:hypothetical protein [Hydrococcus sp. SU_1_0]